MKQKSTNTTQNNTTTMNTTAKSIITVLIISIIALCSYTVKLTEDVKISREIIKSLFEDIQHSDELLLKTHREYSWGVDGYGEDYSASVQESFE